MHLTLLLDQVSPLTSRHFTQDAKLLDGTTTRSYIHHTVFVNHLLDNEREGINIDFVIYIVCFADISIFIVNFGNINHVHCCDGVKGAYIEFVFCSPPNTSTMGTGTKTR